MFQCTKCTNKTVPQIIHAVTFTCSYKSEKKYKTLEEKNESILNESVDFGLKKTPFST